MGSNPALIIPKMKKGTANSLANADIKWVVLGRYSMALYI